MLDDLAFARMQLTAYEAACEPRQWAVLMHDLCDSLPATTACLFVAAADAEQRLIAEANRAVAQQNDVAERVGQRELSDDLDIRHRQADSCPLVRQPLGEGPMLNDQALKRMQLTAYEAASDPRQWAALMHDLCDSFRASTASIFTPVAGAQQRFLAAAAGLDADGQALVAEWAPKDPWLTTRLERHLPMGRGTTARGSDYLPWPQLERTEFYNECGRHIGIKALITTVVEGDDGRFGVPRTHLALTRAPGLPDFGEQELRFLDDLGRPLRAALQSYFALERVQAVERTVEETMEAVPQPLYALRADGFVVHANGPGRSLLADAAVMHTHNGQLLGVGNLTGATWTWALNFGLSGVHRPLSFWWLTHEGVRNGVVHIAPLAYTSPLSECWAAARLLMTVELEDSQQRKTARLAAAARRYGLTSTETSVLGHLRDGMAPEAVAGELAVQLSTVRSHVRHLMEKTGAKRISELVALLA